MDALACTSPTPIPRHGKTSRPYFYQARITGTCSCLRHLLIVNKTIVFLLLPQERSTAEQVFYTWVARSRSGSSSFTASALNKPSSSSSSFSSVCTCVCVCVCVCVFVCVYASHNHTPKSASWCDHVPRSHSVLLKPTTTFPHTLSHLIISFAAPPIVCDLCMITC